MSSKKDYTLKINKWAASTQAELERFSILIQNTSD